MKIISKVMVGSRLYGMAGPNSDTDIRGVFIPATRDVLLCRASRNHKPDKSEGLDEDYFSLHRFVELCCQGQTVGLEMLAAPSEYQLEGSEIWDYLVQHRSEFYTREMGSFVGFAKTQAYKYSLKGERLNQLKAFLSELKLSDAFVGDIANKFADETRHNPQDVREYQIGTKWYGETTPILNVIDSIEKQIARYGLRTIEAGAAGGKDWKSLSHAVRVAMQYKQILTEGDMIFPHPEAPLLRKIKQGYHPLPFVQDYLDTLFEDIQGLERTSELPERVDHEKWNEWLYDVVKLKVYIELRP